MKLNGENHENGDYIHFPGIYQKNCAGDFFAATPFEAKRFNAYKYAVQWLKEKGYYANGKERQKKEAKGVKLCTWGIEYVPYSEAGIKHVFIDGISEFMTRDEIVEYVEKTSVIAGCTVINSWRESAK